MTLTPEDENEIRVAVENNEYVANSYVRQLLAELDEARASLLASNRLELQALRERDALRRAVLDLKVLRASCEDSYDGAFRVHLNEREFDALLSLVTRLK